MSLCEFICRKRAIRCPSMCLEDSCLYLLYCTGHVKRCYVADCDFYTWYSQVCAQVCPTSIEYCLCRFNVDKTGLPFGSESMRVQLRNPRQRLQFAMDTRTSPMPASFASRVGSFVFVFATSTTVFDSSSFGGRSCGRTEILFGSRTHRTEILCCSYNLGRV